MFDNIHLHDRFAAMKHRPARRWIVSGGIILLLVIVGLIAARLFLNVWLLDYVNNKLANLNGYKGSVERIDIDLYRGAYRANNLKVVKTKGNIPVPFIDIETVDLSIQWSALLHGRVVSDADLIKPELNFAINKSGTVQQTGAGVDWSKPIKDLMPIDINLVTIKNGKLSYQDFSPPRKSTSTSII